jgi:hypothetical protein
MVVRLGHEIEVLEGVCYGVNAQWTTGSILSVTGGLRGLCKMCKSAGAESVLAIILTGMRLDEGHSPSDMMASRKEALLMPGIKSQMSLTSLRKKIALWSLFPVPSMYFYFFRYPLTCSDSELILNSVSFRHLVELLGQTIFTSYQHSTTN